MSSEIFGVGEIRVFYDVSGTTVEVLAIVPKSEIRSEGSAPWRAAVDAVNVNPGREQGR